MTPDHGPTYDGDPVTLIPPSAPRGLRYSQINAGQYYSVAIGSDGNLYTWGFNFAGELGHRDFVHATNSMPFVVIKPTSDPAFTWTQISAGGNHSMALGSDGNLYTWGSNQYGQLGRDTPTIGTTDPNPTPSVVAKPTSDPAFTWTQIIAQGNHSMALGSDGNLYTWGSNQYGQLGRDTPTIGTTDPNPTPNIVSKPAGATAGFTWTQANAGRNHSLGIGSDGNLYTWGYNRDGQLGHDTNNAPNPIPTIVAKPTSDPAFTWTQPNGGEDHSMALGSDGNLYTWGNNNNGQLGRTTAGSWPDISPTPGKVTRPTNDPTFTWAQSSAQGDYSMALGSDGNLYTWGDNGVGQLGRTTNNLYSPVPGKVTKPTNDLTSKWIRIAANSTHSMALGSDGNLYTWGYNGDGELGRTDNSTNNNYSSTPGRVDSPPCYPATVMFGGVAGNGLTKNRDGNWTVNTPFHSKGLVDTVITWHRGGVPQQVDAHLPYAFDAPVYQVTFYMDGGSPKPPAQQVSEDQLVTRPADPVKAGYVFDGWFTINAAYDFARPVQGNMTLYAHWTSATEQNWTIDKHLGSELGGEQVTLTPPPPRGIRFGQASAGSEHSMAIGSDGNLYTWGSNRYGQLGRDTGSSGNDPKPGIVAKPAGAPAGFTWTQASAGDHHSMAIGSDGNLYTWGRNLDGQLGRTANNGTDTATTNPGTVNKPTGTPAGFTWTRISAGGGHSLAIGSDGNLYAWGRNRYGQLGRTDNTGTSTPNPTPGIIPKPNSHPSFAWTQISAGGNHSVATGYDGNLYTWGSNQYGQLGRPVNSGTTTPNPTPGAVAKPADAPAGFAWLLADAGGNHTLAVGSPDGYVNNLGDLYSWGLNRYGQLGRDVNTGTWNPNPTPSKVAKPSTLICWLQISAGTYHSMAYELAGQIYSWGSNEYGQLGRTTDNGSNDYTPTPGIVAKPAGAPTEFRWEQGIAGGSHSTAVGHYDSILRTWGDNGDGQLGRGTIAGSNPYDTDPVTFPGPATPTGVRFGTTPGTGLAANTDGTWKITTPVHAPGTFTVTIDWTRDGGAQPPDTGNRYEFRPIAVLPQAGGEGILPLLLIGLLAMGTALAGRRHRQDTTTPTSPE